MTDFRTIKKPLFSTPMDVRAQLDVLDREVSDSADELKTKQDIPDSKIETHISKADAIVHTYLDPIFGASSLVVSTPYFKGPIPAKDNQTSLELMGVILGSGVVTEQWLLVFTADDAFSVFGTYSGAQGSGTIAADFTSTNTCVQIKAVDWLKKNSSDKVQMGDEFMFSTYVSHPTVNAVSTLLATAFLIESLAGTDGSKWGDKLYSRGMKILTDLTDREKITGLGDSVTEADPTFKAVSFTIDQYGRDNSDYDTNIPGDTNPFD